MLLTAAGWLWTVWAVLILLHVWQWPERFGFPTVLSAATCAIYAYGLITKRQFVIWFGWLILAILILSGAINRLLDWWPFLLFLLLQGALAAYTTSRRYLLGAVQRGPSIHE